MKRPADSCMCSCCCQVQATAVPGFSSTIGSDGPANRCTLHSIALTRTPGKSPRDLFQYPLLSAQTRARMLQSLREWGQGRPPGMQCQYVRAGPHQQRKRSAMHIPIGY